MCVHVYMCTCIYVYMRVLFIWMYSHAWNSVRFLIFISAYIHIYECTESDKHNLFLTKYSYCRSFNFDEPRSLWFETSNKQCSLPWLLSHHQLLLKYVHKTGWKVRKESILSLEILLIRYLSKICTFFKTGVFFSFFFFF